MKIIALIPARLESTRLPRKLLRMLDGKTILRRTYEAVLATELFDEVIVVCDNQLLCEEMMQYNYRFMLSEREHESGTDRIAEAAMRLNADIIVNVQADEPFIEKQALQKVIELFQNPLVEIASLKKRITDLSQINNPNCVKVVTDAQGKALYFSRSSIPYNRDQSESVVYFQHIGVYAFRKNVLLKFASLPPSPLEQIEKLENLRMLENGLSVYLAEIEHVGISIDTEEDLLKAIAYLQVQRLV
jgi:3-deoxy-manno-octulosonate cytidylyltransferase (CMP-KDO synthetase)